MGVEGWAIPSMGSEKRIKIKKEVNSFLIGVLFG
jgi:hypothetical protein